MSFFNITLSHSNELETLRLDRLHRVAYMLVAAHTATDYFEDAPEISRLHDHKGDLEVSWKTKPEQQHKECVNMIWQMMNEQSTNVFHAYPGMPEEEMSQLTHKLVQ